MKQQEFDQLCIGDTVYSEARMAKVVDVDSYRGYLVQDVDSYRGHLVQIEYADTKRRSWKGPGQLHYAEEIDEVAQKMRRKKIKKRITEILTAVGFIFFVGWALIAIGSRCADDEEAGKEYSMRTAKMLAWDQAKVFMKRSLRAPSTAKFPWYKEELNA